jgi:hypothetical protein
MVVRCRSSGNAKYRKLKQTALAVKDSVLQHEVKFVIDTGATATPSWKLTRVTVNPDGNLLSFDRTRTHDLLITMGPAVDAVVAYARGGRVVRKPTPDRRAADLHLSALIATDIRAGVRNALRP